jgi:hypothetical protein
MVMWYKSKTLWVNAIAIVGIVFESMFGYPIEPEAQLGILAVINLILRVVTKEELEWKKVE